MTNLSREVEALPSVDLAGVRALVENIISVGDIDPEDSHAAVDALYERVLRAVADGHPQARDLAREVLRLQDADMRRWYA